MMNYFKTTTTTRIIKTSNMIRINDTYTHVSQNLQFNKPYTIYLPEHNITLHANLFYRTKYNPVVQFIILDPGKERFSLCYDTKNYQNIVYSKWYKQEPCEIYMNT
jgi:hypothetical protein